jgi:hypothetical protein
MAAPSLNEFEGIAWSFKEYGERDCAIVSVFVCAYTPSLLVLTLTLPVFDVVLEPL